MRPIEDIVDGFVSRIEGGESLWKAEAEAERLVLAHFWDACGYNTQTTAVKLGLIRTTLLEKLKKYGLSRPAPAPVAT